MFIVEWLGDGLCYCLPVAEVLHLQQLYPEVSQSFPCAPDFPHFPSAVLRLGETYHQQAAYQLDVLPETV